MKSQRPYRLRIATDELKRVAAEILTARQSQASALAQRNFDPWSREFIVHQLQFTRTPFHGPNHPITTDVITITGPKPSPSVEQILEQSQLRPGQSHLILRLGLGVDRSQWQGVVAFADKIEPMDEIKLIGSGLECINRDSEFAELNHSDFDGIDQLSASSSAASRHDWQSNRWDRTLGAIGELPLRRLHQLRVLQFGAGRNGSLIAESLVRLGIEYLCIAEPDDLASENLDATLGSTPDQIGRPKVHSLLAHLQQQRSRTQIVGLRLDAAHPEIVDRARTVDLIVTCVDADSARLMAAKLASRFLIIHLDVGSIIRRLESESRQLEMGLDVRLLLPGSCIVCVGGLRNREAAEQSLRSKPPTLIPGLSRGHQLLPNTQLPLNETNSPGKVGSLISLNQIAVGSAVQLLLDLLTGNLKQSFWLRTLWRPGQAPQSEGFSAMGDPNCEVCNF